MSLNISPAMAFGNNISGVGLTQDNSLVQPVGKSKSNTAANTAAPSYAENPLRTIADKYDVQNITQDAVQALGKDLVEAGIITPSEHAVLTRAAQPPTAETATIADSGESLDLEELLQPPGQNDDTENKENDDAVFDKLLSIVEKMDAVKGSVNINVTA